MNLLNHRRRFLAALAAKMIAPTIIGAPTLVLAKPKRRLQIQNRLGEAVDLHFFDPTEVVDEVTFLFRDWRNNAILSIDPDLIKNLAILQAALDTTTPFFLLSGYRSEATNAALRQRSSSVAQNSLHLTGRAADVAIEGVQPRTIAAVAKNTIFGGVGLYSNSGFVHIDTGRHRRWGH